MCTCATAPNLIANCTGLRDSRRAARGVPLNCAPRCTIELSRFRDNWRDLAFVRKRTNWGNRYVSPEFPLSRKLQAFFNLSHVGDVRQRGFMAGIELVIDRAAQEPYPWQEKIGARVCQEVRRHGVILRPLGNVIVLLPPLSMTIKELTRLLDATYWAIETVTKKSAQTTYSGKEWAKIKRLASGKGRVFSSAGAAKRHVKAL
ncbi:MAG: aminotransferase class III-fold pyridoxal phosphate-dependent enzyme [Candidatus Omnitrophica bacterium]|nr:aminotransferase class III-fold pyridoxal phosphate-dependent enzyme [Candidatus Omnitrophota bacterium]